MLFTTTHPTVSLLKPNLSSFNYQPRLCILALPTMESFSLLKYWRAGGGLVSTTPPNSNGPSLTAAAAENRGESSEDDDDGPFFDLEFAVPDDDEGQAIAASGTTNSTSSGDSDVDVDVEVEPQEDEDEDDVDVEEEGEFNFTVSSGSSNDRTDPNLLSPSDDLFFNGKLVPIEPSSFVFNSAEPNSKPQFAESLLKSATKFRVFMSGLKKSKTNSTTPEHKTEPTHGSVDPPQEKLQDDNNKKQGKLFTVKLKVEEVPIVSLFTRDNSSRISTQTQKQQQSTEEAASADEKRFSKEVVQKYLKLVKPLYVRVSKRYGETKRNSGHLSLSGSPEVVAAASEPNNPKSVVKQGNHNNNNNIPAGLRVVCKHLGKNRSASSAAVAAATAPSQRRDDSLLQQQDGIQSAILHCKRSFNASRETDCNPLSRSVSDSRKPSEVGR